MTNQPLVVLWGVIDVGFEMYVRNHALAMSLGMQYDVEVN